MLDGHGVALLGALVLREQSLVRREIDPPAATVDDRRLPQPRLGLQAGHAAHRRNLKGAGEDGAVRGGAAVFGDDRPHLVHLEPREEGWQDLVHHDHRASLQRNVVLANAE